MSSTFYKECPQHLGHKRGTGGALATCGASGERAPSEPSVVRTLDIENTIIHKN